MIQTNILYRTFFIRAAQYGTAFTLEVNDEEFLITARHLIPSHGDKIELQIFHGNQWLNGKAIVVGRGHGEIDIAVLKIDIRLTPKEFTVTPSSAHLTIGQDIYFLGFPYKMWGDGGSLMGGRPMPFAKKGVVSLVMMEPPQILYVDAINNEGFSGGPLFFYTDAEPQHLRVAGVVSKFRIEYEAVLDKEGNTTDMTTPYNTGFLVAYGIKHALELIHGAK